MKKNLLLIFLCLFLFAIKSNAQNTELWTTTFLGGTPYSTGTIFKINEDGTGFNSVYNFSPVINGPGRGPYGNLAEGINGKLYGTTLFGGTDDSCVLYSYEIGTGVYTMLHDFDHATGYIPSKGMVAAPNGKLYGTTVDGGNTEDGVLYCFDPAVNSYTVIHHFDSVGGKAPLSVPLWINGKLYGATYGGGANNRGVIYCFDVATNTFSVLHHFNTATGCFVYGDLVQGTDGKIYGNTDYGGANNKGVIFSYDILSDTYTNIYDFNISTTVTYLTHSGLIHASNGKLYGMSSYGGMQDKGTLFSFDIITSSFTIVHEFDSINGQHPNYRSNLYEGANGKLYGMTYYGGIFDKGIIFSFDMADNILTKILDFNGSNGSHPMGGFITLSSPAGVSFHSKDKEMLFYPNPTTNKLTISNPQFAIGEIEIYDVIGQKVFGKQSSTDNHQLTIDVSELTNGIYFVKVKTKDGIKTQKLVVQH